MVVEVPGWKEDKKDELDNDEGDNGVEDKEHDEVESILFLLLHVSLGQSKEREEGVLLSSLLTILTTFTEQHCLSNCSLQVQNMCLVVTCGRSQSLSQ